MQRAKAIIVDDEPHALHMLRSIIETDHDHEIDIIAEASDLLTAVDLINRKEPDVVFLDVEMPNHSGLQILDFFDNPPPDIQIVFVTAYSEYAIEAFNLAAIDYLLKPIRKDKLAQTIDRVRHNLLKKTAYAEKLLTFRDNQQNTTDRKIVINTSEGASVVRVSDISYLKAQSSYTEIHFGDGTTLLVSKGLSNFDMLETMGNFMRIHRSVIVNIDRIIRIMRGDGGVVMEGGEEVMISMDKKPTLMNRLNAERL